MTTFVLTPNTPNPLTGFANPVLGWQLTLATALDALTGCNEVFAAGWIPQLTILVNSAADDPIWQLVLNRRPEQVVVNDTDYFVFDGNNVETIPMAVVQADYTVEPQSEGS
jgi:hypothetical protein